MRQKALRVSELPHPFDQLGVLIFIHATHRKNVLCKINSNDDNTHDFPLMVMLMKISEFHHGTLDAVGDYSAAAAGRGSPFHSLGLIDMEPEILKAIPRRLVMMQFMLYVLIGGLAIYFGKTLLFPWIKDYLSVSDKVETLFRFKIVMLGWGIGILLAAVYLAFVAARIIKSKQFPHPGAKVWRDTPIVRGRRALLRGWFLGFGALFLLGCAIYAAYIPYSFPKP